MAPFDSYPYAAMMQYGYELREGQALKSLNGKSAFGMHKGFLVMWALDSDDQKWTSQSHGQSNPGDFAIFQNDGNLCVYQDDGSAQWNSGTGWDAKPNGMLVMQDNKVVAMYGGEKALWSTNA